MNARQIKAQLRASLRDPDFEAQLKNYLAAMSAQGVGRSAHSHATASYNGYLRRQKMYARLALAKVLIDHLRITPTQTVAFVVMKAAFNTATTTKILGDRFGVPQRRATVKYAQAARDALAANPQAIARMRELYEWYCSHQDERVEQIARRVRTAPAQPSLF